jgi:hypothetical protein
LPPLKSPCCLNRALAGVSLFCFVSAWTLFCNLAACVCYSRHVLKEFGSTIWRIYEGNLHRWPLVTGSRIFWEFGKFDFEVQKFRKKYLEVCALWMCKFSMRKYLVLCAQKKR